MTPEKRVQNQIVDYLHKLEDEGFPIFVERRNAGGFSYKKGIPDLYAAINGQHVEIEVKREYGGELSTMQLKFRDLCKKRKIVWICAKSVDDVKKLVEELFLSQFVTFKSNLSPVSPC